MKKENTLLLALFCISCFLFYKIIVVKAIHKIKSYPRNITAEFYIQPQEVNFQDILKKIYSNNYSNIYSEAILTTEQKVDKAIEKGINEEIKDESKKKINKTINESNNKSDAKTKNLTNQQKSELKINLQKKETFRLNKIFFKEYEYLVDELFASSLKKYQTNFYASFTGKIKITKKSSPVFRIDSNQFFSFFLYKLEGNSKSNNKKLILQKERLEKQKYAINMYPELEKGIYLYRIHYFQEKEPTKLQMTYWLEDKKNSKPFGKNSSWIKFIFTKK